MKKYLFYLAVAGWILGLVVHVLSVIGIDVAATIPSVWILHVGIFVVWLPAILALRKNRELQEFQRSGGVNKLNPLSTFKIMFKDVPVWLTVIAVGGLLYAGVNMLLFLSLRTGVPDITNGEYILHNHGQLIKKLTEQEYHHYRANQLRGFSGHWLAFYGIAAAVLFPFGKRRDQ